MLRPLLLALVACICGARAAPTAAPTLLDGDLELAQARARPERAWPLFARNRRRLAGLLDSALDARATAALCGGSTPMPARVPRALRWVHVPKAGSTFFNTLLSHACPEAADAFFAGGRALPSVADALRYYAGTGPRCRGEARCAAFAGNCSAGAGLLSSRWADARAQATHAPLEWSREPPGELVGLFRLPDQRLLSAFCYGLHAWSMRNAMRRRMAASVREPAKPARARPRSLGDEAQE